MRELVLLAALILWCQVMGQNLVPNHSFEIIDPCPQAPNSLGYQEGAIPTGWWRWGGTPDYFNSCISDTLGSVPVNLWGYQPAINGNAYSGFYSNFFDGGTDGIFRETIGTELTETLIIGQTYYASMYVSLSLSEYYTLGLAHNKMGLLCTTTPHYTNDPINDRFPIQNRAHVYATGIIVDTTGWALITGSFIADSAYNYVVLGNHFDNENTDTSYVIINTIPVSYYYVDNVCLSPNPNGCDISHGIYGDDIDHVVLYPNPVGDHIFITGIMSPTEVTVIDATGRMVMEERLIGQSVFIGHLANGLYQVLLWDKARLTHTQKIMKQ
ncbi:MAG: T9SS type A sorting domain-containing protein [Bacteroidota bacterium]|nr:T9SS type A sorting domain-containing protein [Bacteroidota bacterium]